MKPRNTTRPVLAFAKHVFDALHTSSYFQGMQRPTAASGFRSGFGVSSLLGRIVHGCRLFYLLGEARHLLQSSARQPVGM